MVKQSTIAYCFVSHVNLHEEIERKRERERESRCVVEIGFIFINYLELHATSCCMFYGIFMDGFAVKQSEYRVTLTRVSCDENARHYYGCGKRVHCRAAIVAILILHHSFFLLPS